MKKFLKSTGGKVCLTCLILLLLTAAALGGYTYWASWISREAMPILQKAIIEKIGAFLEE